MPRKKITYGGTPGLGAVWAGGPGSGLTAGASLRKATLIECDPAPAVCARSLTIEIFLTRNLGSTMPRSDEPTKPMTLGNMRSLGVRSLFAACRACGHKTKVNVDAWPDDVLVSSFGPHMRCRLCGNLGATAIPNLIERGNSLPGTRR
jgi:hypothetical protein